ncbi:MAG: hypothetical protein GX864_01735, partial [Mollicutes bacterium]|nr:hypothetical protein [Mollicutes bacterium]
EYGRNLYGIKSVIPDPDYYNEETNLIIAYSIDDLIQTGYVYKLLYRAQKLGVRIEIAHKEIKDNYTDEELDVLAYLDEQEGLISDRYLKQN